MAVAAGGPCDDLSILCVTKAEGRGICNLLGQLAFAASELGAEFSIGADGSDAMATICRTGPLWGHDFRLFAVQSKGYVESALDDAIAHTDRHYVLRIDDDESISPAMLGWLKAGAYRTAEHWQFSRQHMWDLCWGPYRDGDGCLMTPHLWPDYQTRLSVRDKAGGRAGVHAPSPHGGGEIAPVSIVHWKYVVRTREDRRRIAQTYDAYSPGYGTGNMKPFSLPEEAYETMRVVEAGDGSVPWTPRWETVVDNRDHGF